MLEPADMVDVLLQTSHGSEVPLLGVRARGQLSSGGTSFSPELEAIAIRLEAIASRLEAMAIRYY